MKTALAVASVGMVTAIGDDAEQTIAALAADRRRVVETSLIGPTGEPIAGSFVLPVRPECEGLGRAVALAWPAFVECLDAIEQTRGPSALFVCVPLSWGSFGDIFAPLVSHTCEVWPAVADALAAEAEARGLAVPPALRFVIARGHAAGALALEQAADLLHRREAFQAVIVGLDTHGERATLERLALTGAIKSRRSPGGFIPGEAAAVLCVRQASETSGGVLLRGVAIHEERETPSTARGLTSAMADSIAAWGGPARSIATVAIDLNGERARAKEWSFAATRTLWRERTAPLLVRPAERLGDVGAASLPLLVGLLARGGKRPGPAMAVGSSRDGLRAGVVIDGVA